MDVFSEIAESILAIKSDPELKRTFVEILEIGSCTQQVRVSRLLEVLAVKRPPEKLTRFIALLKDDKIANLVYAELNK